MSVYSGNRFAGTRYGLYQYQLFSIFNFEVTESFVTNSDLIKIFKKEDLKIVTEGVETFHMAQVLSQMGLSAGRLFFQTCSGGGI